MAIKIGNVNVVDMYLGSQNVSIAYMGDIPVVFKNDFEEGYVTFNGEQVLHIGVSVYVGSAP